MKSEEVIELYKKEREYQKVVFGEYIDDKVLNTASFIVFLDNYINKIKSSYSEKWVRDLPGWLIACKESHMQEKAPAEVYEHLIKIMALAGAALETYTIIDVEKWREEGVNDKWK